ncbi:MAG: CCA tRNA nucleotidyltransferase [Candidatus Saccharimonadales bacterium]
MDTALHNHPETDWPHYAAARRAADILNSAGFEAYIIGGAVRDILLGRTPKDFDLATNARPEDILACPEFVRSHYKDTAQAYGVTRVYVSVPKADSSSTHEIELEIATYRQDIEAHLGRTQTKIAFASLIDDLQRRDFTINALALDPISDQVVDQTGGIEDLGRKVVRFIGDPEQRIQEDPLRILRGIRLKVQLDFSFDPQTETALQTAIAHGKLADIAVDRVKFELSRLLMHPSRRQAIEELDRLGGLEQLLPELSATKAVPQPDNLHAEGDVFTHSLLSIGYLPDIVSPRLAWATLLHDIGKVPSYRSQSETGDRIRFDDHHRLGAELARTVLERLRFSTSFQSEVAWMIHYHLAIDELPQMRPRRAENFMHHSAFADLLELHRADAHAAWSKTASGVIDDGPGDFSRLERLWQEFQRQRKTHPPSLKDDLGIDGKWLQQQFDLSPGPLLGEVLMALEDAYLNHEIDNAEEAHKFATTWLQQSNP